MKNENFLDKRNTKNSSLPKNKPEKPSKKAKGKTEKEESPQENKPRIYRSAKSEMLKLHPSTICPVDEEIISVSDVEQISNNFELVEEIPFKNGKNTLSIKLFKKPNRLFCVKVFLNETYEIRPITYTGISTGTAFFQLLKAALK